MMKKMTACVLTAAMTIGLLALPASAAEVPEEPVSAEESLLTEATEQEASLPTGAAQQEAQQEESLLTEAAQPSSQQEDAPVVPESGNSEVQEEESGTALPDADSPAENWEEDFRGMRAQILREVEEEDLPETLYTELDEPEETLYTEYALTIPDGHYYLVSGVGSSMVLDVRGASKAKSANVQIYTKNGTKAQQFHIERVNGYYRIVNDNSGYCLDVYGGSSANKANIQQYPWNGTNAQLWEFEDAGSGYFYIKNVGSGKALDVYGGKSANGTNVHQYTANGTTAQKWKLTTLSGAPVSGVVEETEGPNDYVGQGGTYHIFSMVDTEYAVDLYGGSAKDLANIQLYKYNGTAAQSWVFSYQGNGYYKITNKKSGKALDVYAGKARNKSNVQQYTWNGSKAQLWKIKENGDDTCQLVSALDESFVLDLSGGIAANKRNIWIYKGNGSTAQKWTLYPEGTAPEGSGSGSGSGSSDSGSYTDPDSNLVIVNKKHPLSSSYAPGDLVAVNTLTYDGRTVYMRAEAAAALKTMFDAAKNEGIYLKAGSGYRSYSTQSSLYSNYVANYGQASADRFSARPGYSEHQTGLAMDISDYSEANYVEESFEDTEEGIWLAKNAYKYGFILRYPATKESVTGYMYEPWHFRYVGVSIATEIYSRGADYTYEEYTGLPGGDY